MSFQNVHEPAKVDRLIKDLAMKTGAAVKGNKFGTTPLIAHNGNTYEN